MPKFLIEDSYIVNAADEISALVQLDCKPHELGEPDYTQRFKVKRVIKRLPDSPAAAEEQPDGWLEPKLYHPGEPSEADRNPDAELDD
jgi:hypothetical protein